MHFQDLAIEDIPVIRPFFDFRKYTICDYTIGAMFMWRDYYKIQYCIEDGILYSRVMNQPGSRIYYQVPIGDGDIRQAIGRIIGEERRGDRRLNFVPIPEEDLPLFEGQAVPFSFHNNHGTYADYVYDYDDFCSLSGKRNHKKKNHINQFDRYCTSWRFEEITPADTDALRAFLEASYSVAEDADEIELEEMRAVYDVLDHYAAYGMTGGILYADDAIAGFTIGECVGDILFVHIEKADTKIPGAYQKLNHEYAVRYGAGMKLINREDDSGDEGLRRSKLSYHPVYMAEKYVAEEMTLGSCI